MWQILPAYDLMKSTIDNALIAVTSNIYLDIDDQEEKSRIQVNIMNADAKLLKYQQLLISPVYLMAVVLVPWCKWRYFESKWTPAEVGEARIAVQKFYDNHCSSLITSDDTSVSTLQSVPPIVPSIEPGLLQSFFNSTCSNHSNKLQDEYQRYCLKDVALQGSWGSSLEWWKAHQEPYSRLAKLARDIMSIPGMSAEVERLFSSAKLMLPPSRNHLAPDAIEAGECIRSWRENGLV